MKKIIALCVGALLATNLLNIRVFADESTKLGSELLVNGQFKDGDSNWELETLGGSRGKLTVNGDGFDGKPALVVTVETTGTESDKKLWAVQLFQRELSFKKGEKYRLTFAAKSSDGRWAFVTLGETIPPYGVICQGSQITLTQEWQLFSYTFTILKDTSSGRLLFTNLNVGGQSRSISNISLRKIE